MLLLKDGYTVPFQGLALPRWPLQKATGLLWLSSVQTSRLLQASQLALH